MSEEEALEKAREIKDVRPNLPAKWSKGELEYEDVKIWLKKRLEMMNKDEELNERGIKHVAHGLYKIYLWDKGKDTLGDFLSAVIDNDFIEMWFRADGDNRKCLGVYAEFLYHVAPSKFLDEKVDYR